MQSNSRRRGFALRAALACALSAVGISVLPAVAGALPITAISGRITNTETNAGIASPRVCLYNEGDMLESCQTVATNGAGEYTLEGLTEGHYFVGFTATGFATQYWKGVSSLFEATPVEVTTGDTTKNINAALEETGEGSIAGRVTNAANGQGAGGIEVCADGREVDRCVDTNGNGEYGVSGLQVGSYSIYFYPTEACEEEQGERVRCQPSANYIATSAAVKVKANATEIANIVLQPGGQISGAVTSASITHPGIGRVQVCATKVESPTEEFGPGGCAYTNSTGQYAISGLESGAYKVNFSGYICSIVKKGEEECPEVYVSQYYHGKQTRKLAEPIAVATGADTGAINESLREAFPTIPASSGAPVLTGTPAVGQALTCSQGAWLHEPTYVASQWLRNGTVISGQSGSAYALVAADQGQSITCAVWAGNDAGVVSATSNAIKVPVPLAVFTRVKVKGSVASVTLRCPGPGACSGVLKLVARVVTKHGQHKKTSNLTVGSASFSMAAGKSLTLRVHLTGQGRKLVTKAGRRGLKVNVAGTGVQARGATLKAA